MSHFTHARLAQQMALSIAIWLATLIISVVAITYTPLGTQLALSALQYAHPGLSFHYHSGTLAHGLTLHQVRWQHPKQQWQIHTIAASWSDKALWRGQLEVFHLNIDNLRFHQSQSSDFNLSMASHDGSGSIQFPAIFIHDLSLKSIQLIQNRQTLVIDEGRLSGHREQGRWHIDHSHFRTNHGDWVMQGALDWSAQRHQLTYDISHWAPFPGSDLFLNGQWQYANRQHDFHLSQLTGEYRGLPCTAQAHLQWTPERLTALNVSGALDSQTFQARWPQHPHQPAQLSAQFTDLSAWWPDIQGSISLEGQCDGTTLGDCRGQVQLSNVQYTKGHISELTATLNAHQWQIKGNIDNAPIQWMGRDGMIHQAQVGAYHLDGQFDTQHWPTTRCFQNAFGDGLCLANHTLTFQSFPTHWLSWFLPEKHHMTGQLSGTYQWGEQWHDVHQLALTLAQAQYHYFDHLNTKIQWAFPNIQLNAHQQGAELLGALVAKHDQAPDQGIDLNWALLKQPQKPWTQWPIHGHLAIQAYPATDLNLVAPIFSGLSGVVHANIPFQGHWHHLKTTDLSLELDHIDIPLTDTQTTLHWDRLALSGDHLDHLELNGHGTLGGGPLSLSGQWQFWPTQQGQVSLETHAAQLIDTSEYQIKGDAQLYYRYTPAEQVLTGNIDVASANIVPPQTIQTTTHSQDVVVLQRPQVQKSPPLTLNLNVHLPEQGVHFSGFNTEAGVKGDLSLRQQPQQPLKAHGSLQLYEGQYTTYGRTFDLSAGELLFTGGPITNPSVAFQVERQVYSPEQTPIIVGIQLTDSLQQPTLNFYARPTLEANDILAYLLFDHPFSNNTNQQIQLFSQVVQDLIRQVGNSHQNKSWLNQMGLSIDMESTGDSLQDTRLTIGKQFSDQLFLYYTHNFSDAMMGLRLRYLLNRHFTLEADTASQGYSADLLWHVGTVR